MNNRSPEKIDVLWLVEHVARELDVACAVKAIAESGYNLKIKILPLFGDIKSLGCYDPTVITIPYGFSAKNARIPELLMLWPDKIYFNLSWEELYYNAYLKARVPNDTWSRKCVIHHAWGDFYKDYLVENGVPDDHIFVNGQPAYKFYDEPYRNLFFRRNELAAKLKLDNSRNWIFFPENYGWAFKSESTLKKFVQYQDMKWDELIEMRDYCRESLHIVLSWIVELTGKYDVEFILRPRPATPQADFEKFVKDHIGAIPRRLHITTYASVREWILASNITLSSISTSLIEAALADKPAYMINPRPVPFPLQAEWHRFTTRINSKDHFFRACLDDPNNDASLKLRSWGRDTLLSNGDPLANLADFLVKLCNENSSCLTGGMAVPYDVCKSEMKKSYKFAIHDHDLFDDNEIVARTNQLKSLLDNMQSMKQD